MVYVLIMSQINNHLAHRSNQINLSLADSSQKIAMDTQRDSSIMKSIAVLTMTFLPATYIAVCLLSLNMKEFRLTKPSLSLLLLELLPRTHHKAYTGGSPYRPL
jgi:hypothetical protein